MDERKISTVEKYYNFAFWKIVMSWFPIPSPSDSTQAASSFHTHKYVRLFLWLISMICCSSLKMVLFCFVSGWGIFNFSMVKSCLCMDGLSGKRATHYIAQIGQSIAQFFYSDVLLVLGWFLFATWHNTLGSRTFCATCVAISNPIRFLCFTQIEHHQVILPLESGHFFGISTVQINSKYTTHLCASFPSFRCHQVFI